MELIGYSLDDLGTALEAMENSINFGESCAIKICTERMPSQEMLDSVYVGILESGHHVSEPVATQVGDIVVTSFAIKKGSPQWQLIVPLIIPLVVVGFLIFSITKIGEWAPWIIGTILAVGGIAIALAVLLRKPAQAYIERGGKIPLLPATKYLPSTSPKALAAR